MVSVKCHPLMLQTRCKICYEYSVEIKITICTLHHKLCQKACEQLISNIHLANLQQGEFAVLWARGVNIYKANSANNFKSLLQMTSTAAPKKKKVDITPTVCVLISLHILHHHCLTGFWDSSLELSGPICWLISLYTDTQAQKRPPYSFCRTSQLVAV